MIRRLSRLWLVLWAGLFLAPLAVSGEAGPAGKSPTLSEREHSALVSRAPAITRTLQLQDQGPGSGATPLLSLPGLTPLAPTDAIEPATDSPFAVLPTAVLSRNYPTGPPPLS